MCRWAEQDKSRMEGESLSPQCSDSLSLKRRAKEKTNALECLSQQIWDRNTEFKHQSAWAPLQCSFMCACQSVRSCLWEWAPAVQELTGQSLMMDFHINMPALKCLNCYIRIMASQRILLNKWILFSICYCFHCSAPTTQPPNKAP